LTLPPENDYIFGISEGNNNELPDGNLILQGKIKGRVKTLPYRDCAINTNLIFRFQFAFKKAARRQLF